MGCAKACAKLHSPAATTASMRNALSAVVIVVSRCKKGDLADRLAHGAQHLIGIRDPIAKDRARFTRIDHVENAELFGGAKWRGQLPIQASILNAVAASGSPRLVDFGAVGVAATPPSMGIEPQRADGQAAVV